MSLDNSFIEYIKEKLPISGKNTKLLSELEQSIGLDAAYALLSQLGIGDIKGKASKDEIKLIAYMIEPFKPLKIRSYDKNKKPLTVVLDGVGPEGSTIRIHPQYQVPQSGFDGKDRNWSIDVVIECYKVFNNDEFKVCGIAIEYDGHDAHFRDHNIERSYLRDISIKESTRFSTIHVTKDSWSKKKQLIKGSIVKSIAAELDWFASVYKKAFEHGVRSKEKLPVLAQKDTNHELPNNSLYSTSKKKHISSDCPKCLGNCILYGDTCDYCKGKGDVNRYKAVEFNRLIHGYVTCPHCNVSGLDCHKCGGKGKINVCE